MDLYDKIEYTNNEKTQKISRQDINNLTLFEKEELFNYPKIYYLGDTKISKYNKKPNSRFNYSINDNIDYRYQIQSLLGSGAFGDVLACHDHKTNKSIAIKIVKDEPRFHTSCKNEINILNIVSEKSKYVISLLRNFKFRGHDCMEFEKLHINLVQHLKNMKYQPLSEFSLNNITRQILCGLSFLKDNKIIHGDLKPENIMFIDTNLTDIKILDFGSSLMIEKIDMYYTYIQTRWYRSPEVMLGYPIDYKIDIWSFGCILYELANGKPIFPGNTIYSQLYRYNYYIGQPDKTFLEECKVRDKYFIDNDLSNKTIKKANIRHPLVFNLINSKISKIVNMILKWEPYNRPEINQLLNLQWYNDN